MTTNSKHGRTILRRAREQFLERGELPLGYMVNSFQEWLLRSWRRSADAGLEPEGRLPESGRLEEHQLARAKSRQQELIAHARPVMEYLHTQTQDSGSMVILADDHGVILQTYGDTDFLSRAERVKLQPGACWDERYRGTNGIGTAIAEARPLVVQGNEHYLERNSFLSCAAAPVMAPNGKLLGVLDISGDNRRHHPHTLALIRASAQMLENRLFNAQHEHSLRIRFHSLAEGIGTFSEGLAALSEDGWIIGANQTGFALLGIVVADLGITPLSRILQTRIEDLLDWSRRRSDDPMLVVRKDGTRLFVRIEPGRAKPTSTATPVPARTQDALAAIDTGDERLATAIDKARKLIGKPIGLLLQGEPGVGKDCFARAFHASGPRHDGPFIAVNCAALQPNLLETELFGYAKTLCRDEFPGRLREAHGGTLFVEEIGDLPLPLQARLLRVLQEKQLTPLGGDAPLPADFALVCATQRNLKTEIEAGRFSADFYYRINGITLLLPPLRERQDFPQLLARLLEELAPGRGISLEPALATAFADYAWPGNISQLINALRTASSLLDADENHIGWKHLPDDLAEELRWQAPPPPTSGAITENLQELSNATIARAIALSHGNMSEAARRLGISRNTLYRRVRSGNPSPDESGSQE